MRQSGLGVLCATLALMLAVPMLVVPAQAQENGVVRLEGLPQRASVYVDGKNVTVEQGRIAVPVGRHEIQVEARRPGCRLSGMEPIVVLPAPTSCVEAWRTRVQVEPDHAVALQVDLLPVEVATNWGGVRIGQGPPGRRGWIGPAGPHQTEDTTALHTATLTAGKMRYYLSLMLVDLYEQVRTLHPHVEWYNAPPTLYWFKGKTGPPPMSVAGPAGPPGPVGLPAAVRQFRTKSETLLIDKLVADLGVLTLRQRLQGVEGLVGASMAAPVRSPENVQTIQIYTTALHALLEQQENLWSKADVFRDGSPGPPGVVGLRGPMGPHGSLAAGDPTVTLEEAEVAKITATLREDAEIERWLNLVEAQLQTLERGAAVKSEESK